MVRCCHQNPILWFLSALVDVITPQKASHSRSKVQFEPQILLEIASYTGNACPSLTGLYEASQAGLSGRQCMEKNVQRGCEGILPSIWRLTPRIHNLDFDVIRVGSHQGVSKKPERSCPRAGAARGDGRQGAHNDGRGAAPDVGRAVVRPFTNVQLQ